MAGDKSNVYEDNKEGFPPISNNPNNTNTYAVPNKDRAPNPSGGFNVSRALNGGKNTDATGKPSIVSSTIKKASTKEIHDNGGDD